MTKTKLGLALSGGAALGAAHIGVIDVLAEAGFEADVVAGTSIGSIVGAAYVTDKMPTLRKLALEATRWQMAQLSDPIVRGAGLFAGRRITALVREHFAECHIEQLDKPFGAVAVDLTTGREHVATRGLLVDALRASISIPGVFEPVVTEDAVLVDGGLLEPLPVAACRALGADRVIAVDVMGDVAGGRFRRRCRQHALGELRCDDQRNNTRSADHFAARRADHAEYRTRGAAPVLSCS